METPGLDTIIGLVGQPPKTISVPYKIMRTEELLRQGWNGLYIAIIPYCFKCREPLVWHNSSNGKVLFHCPKCKRKWLKDKNWENEKQGVCPRVRTKQ